MAKKKVDLLDPNAVSDFASFIDELAKQTLEYDYDRSSLKGRERESDETAAARIIIEIFEYGGGVKNRYKLRGLLEKLILARMIDIQGGEHVLEGSLNCVFVPKNDK